MSIRVTCPWCEDSFKARDEYAGKRVKCPKCGEVLQVPEGADASRLCLESHPVPRPPNLPLGGSRRISPGNRRGSWPPPQPWRWRSC